MDKIKTLSVIWKSGLKGSLGFLKYFDFTPNEITAFASKEADFNSWARKLEYQQPSKKEREDIFSEVTQGEVHEMRRKYLEDDLRQKSARYFELANKSNPLLLFSEEQAKQDFEKAKKNYDYHLQVKTTKQVSEADIAHARDREIGDFISIDKGGFAPCPFHSEKTASFHATKNLWNCFGCGEKGDTIGFIMKRENLSFIKAIKYLL